MDTTTNNLFGSATAVKKATKSTSKDYREVTVDGDISESMDRLDEVRTELANAKSEETMISGEVKERAKEEYLKLYNTEHTNPKTFILRGANTAFMVQPMDKYLTIDPQRAVDLIGKYGEDIIEAETTFEFNSAILNKEGNMDKISKAIMESDLTQDEKNSLIQQKVKQTIKKGSIDNLLTFGDVGEVLGDIQPIFALKNYK